jgi:PAS domain S-box-containing protein
MAVSARFMHVSSTPDSPPAAAASNPAAPQVGPLFERVLDAIVVADLSGRIVLWNSAAEQLFGYSAEEAVGRSIEILMPSAIAEVHRAGLARYVRTGHGLIADADTPVEMPARTRSGEEIRVELKLSELRDANGARFAVATIRDANMRKQLELTNLELVQARVARSEVELEVAVRDELLESVAAMLEEEPSREQLRRIARAIEDFRQMHSGQVPLEMADTDLVDIVHAVCDAARRANPERHLLIQTPPAARVICDRARTRQAVEQVLEEVTSRTRDGARVQLVVEVVSAHLVQLAVTSEACGDSHLTGPGLQLSRGLVQRQGGTFTTTISSSGSLEVLLTLPGSSQQSRGKRPPRSPSSRRDRR